MAPRREGTFTFCVYGSSSPKTPESYREASRTLGNLLADRGHVTVNGAGKYGCMGALNDGVTERCGRVRGVIHEMWVVDKCEHPSIKDLRVVGGQGLQERKRVLTEDADCIIALPGGMGTWDELWEAACLKGIGLSATPICVVDVNGFYEGFRMQLQRAQDDLLLYGDPDRLVHFETTPEGALNWCEAQLKDPDRVKRNRQTQPTKRISSATSVPATGDASRQSAGRLTFVLPGNISSTTFSKHSSWVCGVAAVATVVAVAAALKQSDRSG